MRVSSYLSNSGSELACICSARHLGAAIVNLLQNEITQQCECRKAPKGQGSKLRSPLLGFLELVSLTLRQPASNITVWNPAEVVIGGAR